MVAREPPHAPDLFDDELAAILKRITNTPTLGTIYPSAFDVVVRRVFMAKTNNHVYYAVHEGEVVVLSVWGVPRRCGPNL